MITNRDAIKVRRARTDDAKSLASIFARTWWSAYAGIIPAMPLARMIQKRDEAWWRKSINSESCLLVIQVSRDLAGYATCGAARSNGMRGEIFELYISPEYQGMSLGEHLFEACRYHLDQRGLRGLTVWALSDNAGAAAFYRRCGGRPVASCVERFGGTEVAKTAFGFA